MPHWWLLLAALPRCPILKASYCSVFKDGDNLYCACKWQGIARHICHGLFLVSFDRLVQERRNSSALEMELRLFRTTHRLVYQCFQIIACKSDDTIKTVDEIWCTTSAFAALHSFSICYHYRQRQRGPIVLTLIDFNPSMEKYPYKQLSVWWNYVSILKLHRWHLWTLGTDK